MLLLASFNVRKLHLAKHLTQNTVTPVCALAQNHVVFSNGSVLCHCVAVPPRTTSSPLMPMCAVGQQIFSGDRRRSTGNVGLRVFE